MSGEKGGCWYLHKNTSSQPIPETIGDFNCSSCNNTFKTKGEVMKHRLINHEEEVPMCNSIAERKKCSKSDRCWFRHKNNVAHTQCVVPNQSC